LLSRRRLGRGRAAVLAVAVALALTATSAAAQPAGAEAAAADALCAATARRAATDPRAVALVELARRQHALFGRQEIDTAGRLVRAGYAEAEFDRGPGDPDPTWRKVQRFWQAWSPREPGQVRDSQGRFQRTDLLRQAVQGASTARLGSFGGGLRDLGLSAREADALDTSVLRAALVDTPWSAVFVSWLVREAGFGAEAFTFSDAHADYARAAFATRVRESAGSDTVADAGAWTAPAPDPAAYRACDLATTAPRPGDLVCNTRARAAGIDSFAALDEALQAGGSLPMHCDLVVAVDAPGKELQAIGGNVLQSVTLRRLALQPAADADAGGPPLLSARYREQASSPDAGLNDQPWTLLMQLR